MCATCQAVYREKGFCFLNHTCGKHAKSDGKKNGETTCLAMPVFINRDHKLPSATSSEPVMAQERSRKHLTLRSSESQFLWGRLPVPIVFPESGRKMEREAICKWKTQWLCKLSYHPCSRWSTQYTQARMHKHASFTHPHVGLRVRQRASLVPVIHSNSFLSFYQKGFVKEEDSR